MAPPIGEQESERVVVKAHCYMLSDFVSGEWMKEIKERKKERREEKKKKEKKKKKQRELL